MKIVNSLAVMCLFGACMAAPKPVDWDNLGRRLKNFGGQVQNKYYEIRDKVLPVAKDACGIINTIPTGNSNELGGGDLQGYYPSVGRSFPQAPGFPSYRRPSSYYPRSFNSYPYRPSSTNFYPGSNSPNFGFRRPVSPTTEDFPRSGRRFPSVDLNRGFEETTPAVTEPPTTVPPVIVPAASNSIDSMPQDEPTRTNPVDPDVMNNVHSTIEQNDMNKYSGIPPFIPPTSDEDINNGIEEISDDLFYGPSY